MGSIIKVSLYQAAVTTGWDIMLCRKRIITRVLYPVELDGALEALCIVRTVDFFNKGRYQIQARSNLSPLG